MSNPSHFPNRATVTLCMGLMLAVGCRAPARKAMPVPEPGHRPGVAASEPYEEPAALDTRPAPVTVTCEQRVLLGESVEGRPIELFVFGEGGQTTLVIGGIHGDEATGSDLAIALIGYLSEHSEAYADRCVMIAPSVNPDGLAARHRRNANGVDINRNFPATNFPNYPGRLFAGGREPVSEPETQAVLDAVDLAQPDKIISFHSISRGRHGNNYDGPALALAQEMGNYNGYPVLPTMGYLTPGSLGSWAGVDQGIPTITLELPRDADGPACWEENHEALLAAINFSTQPPVAVDPPILGK